MWKRRLVLRSSDLAKSNLIQMSPTLYPLSLYLHLIKTQSYPHRIKATPCTFQLGRARSHHYVQKYYIYKNETVIVGS